MLMSFFFFFLYNLIDCVCTTNTHSMVQECQELHPAGIKKCGKRGKKGGMQRARDSVKVGVRSGDKCEGINE